MYIFLLINSYQPCRVVASERQESCTKVWLFLFEETPKNMKKIYKYKIEILDEQEIFIPCYHTILCIKLQSGTPYIWVEVEDDAPLQKVKFKLYGTGHEMSKERPEQYVGTILLNDDKLVYHLYRQL